MNDKGRSQPQGLTWEILRKVFPVAPSLRREHWDLLSGLGIEELQRNDDGIFYEALLHRFRRDTAFIIDFDRRFLASKRKKDRDKSFTSRAMLWLHREIPALIDYDDFCDAPSGLFGDNGVEQELRDMLVDLFRVAEEAVAGTVPDVEGRWELARLALRRLLDEEERPSPEAIERIEFAAKALMDAGRDYGKLAAETERRRSAVRAALKPVSDRKGAAEVLERLGSLDAGRLVTLADMAEKVRDHVEMLAEAEARLAEKASEFDRLRSGRASWSTIARQAGVMAELETERDGRDAALSTALTRMAAFSAPQAGTDPGDKAAPASGRKAARRRTEAPTEEPEPQPPDPAGTEGPAAEPPLPATWAAFPGWCEQYLGGRLALFRSRPQLHQEGAIRGCRSGGAVPALACRRLSPLPGWKAPEKASRAPSPAGAGFRNERCGGDSFDFLWQGKRVRADWHVKNGGNTRDPSRCLRIYYCWHENGEGGQVLVGDMPAHVRSRVS